MFKLSDHHREIYYQRVRRVKRWLRPLPRRATIHNYPVLKWFADTARKRNYLWSFKRDAVVTAIYAGCILTFLPLYGVQIGLAFVLAILFRANLMVLVALQLISNPLTVAPMWVANYYVGDFILNSFSIDATELHLEGMRGFEESGGIVLTEGMKRAFGYYGAITLGGAILGYFTGFILSFIYQYTANRYILTHPKSPGIRPIDPIDRGDTSIPFPDNDNDRSSA